MTRSKFLGPENLFCGISSLRLTSTLRHRELSVFIGINKECIRFQEIISASSFILKKLMNHIFCKIKTQIRKGKQTGIQSVVSF